MGQEVQLQGLYLKGYAREFLGVSFRVWGVEGICQSHPSKNFVLPLKISLAISKRLLECSKYMYNNNPPPKKKQLLLNSCLPFLFHASKCIQQNIHSLLIRNKLQEQLEILQHAMEEFEKCNTSPTKLLTLISQYHLT